jgi:hypothetical protein
MIGMSDLSGIGNIPGALQSAQVGINRGMNGLDRDAQTVAGAIASPAGTDSLPGALVDSLQQKLLVEANVKMLATVDQTIGSLLDATA